MAEIAAKDVVASPTITASHSLTDGIKGFDLDAGDYAIVGTDSACWIKIDFGENKYIQQIRVQAGPDTSGTHTLTLDYSTDDVNWTEIFSWVGQTYYSTLTDWKNVNASVRYIRITKTAPNYMRVFYMGVITEPSFIITEDVGLNDTFTLIGFMNMTEAVALDDTFSTQMLQQTITEDIALNDTFSMSSPSIITEDIALNDGWTISLLNPVKRKKLRIA